MPNLVLVSQAAAESEYTPDHIRLLLRNKIIQGEKQGGIWLVDIDDLRDYEENMSELGPQKYDPTRGREEG